MDYKEAYEKEHIKNAELAGQIADLEAKNEELQSKLDRLAKNPLWKITKPLRSMLRWGTRQAKRVANCGGPKGIAAKLAYIKREHTSMKQLGTASFPTPEQAALERETVFDRPVRISILVPLYNTPDAFLREMLDSVLAQTYENWELCLADGSDAEHAYVGDVCRKYIEKDREYLAAKEHMTNMSEIPESRIIYRKLAKNGGIAENTNACYEMAAGEYVGLFDHDDILHPSALFAYVKAINEQGADYLYCDEATFKNGNINRMLTIHFKPDYAPDNLRANNYICHFSVFAKRLMEGTELFRTKFNGSQDHDMILRLTDRAEKIVHIPRLLYYWRSHEGSVASGIDAKPYAVQAAKGAVSEHLKAHGFENFKIESTRAFETIFRIRYQIIGNPKISIIIANKDHGEDLRRCISSILKKSTYDNYEIIVVENNSTEPEIFSYYKELETEERIKLVTYKGGFNYSAINNLGVKHASGDYVLLLNNDTEVISVNWLEELLMYAQREDVGAVGAKLYYADKTIQHAGVVIGLGAHRTAGHTHYKKPRQNLGYMGRLCYAQNVSAVTGACLMVKRADYEAAGGLDESFAVSLNDVDFCLKLRGMGLLNVFTPFAELYHYESASRGLDDKGEKAERYNAESERFRSKWREALEAGDPYYNPNFSLDRSDFSLKVK